MPHAMTKYVKERADIDYSTTFFKSAINTFWNYHPYQSLEVEAKRL